MIYKIVRKSKFDNYFLEDFAFSTEDECITFMKALAQNIVTEGACFYCVAIDSEKCISIQREKLERPIDE
tara:strand:- start:986 stop:1195 length:210 start_codon:yes stop_codon:yes gene_type:complete